MAVSVALAMTGPPARPDNCQNTVPSLKVFDATYRAKGLTEGIKYPNAQDNDRGLRGVPPWQPVAPGMGPPDRTLLTE